MTTSYDEFCQRIAEAIKRDGRMIIGVFGSKDDLPFSYTIGNQGVGLPELLMIGIGADSAAQGLLNLMSERMRKRGRPFDDGEIVDIGARCSLQVINANENAKRDYTIQAGRFYKTQNYQVQQIVVPDKAGRFPGDPLCEQPYCDCPVLRVVH